MLRIKSHFLINVIIVTTISARQIKSVEERESCLNLSYHYRQPAHFLVYPDKTSQPVLIPFPSWTSAQTNAYIYFILLGEVMNYSVKLVRVDSLFTNGIASYAAGCLDPDDPFCIRRDVNNPTVHFTIESWLEGALRVESLPENIRPKLLRVLNLKGDVQSNTCQDDIFIFKECSSNFIQF